MTDRPYQEQALAAIQAAFVKDRATLLVLATGLGKTRVFCRLAQSFPGRVLILAHRDELIDQAAKAYQSLTGEPVEIEQAELRGGAGRVVVGSIQTMCRQRRLERYHRDAFSLVIIDEAHRSCAASYRKVLDYFSTAKVLGVTATPDRGDGRALGKIFQSVCFRMDIDAGVAGGWLVPLQGKSILMKSCNLDMVPLKSGDLAADVLDEAIIKEAEFVVQELFALNLGQTVLFAPGVRSARYIAERMNHLVPGVAVCVDGKQDEFERRDCIRRYKSGLSTYLINCMVATEGFDAPNTRAVAILRPTKSRALYCQMVGRGTRTEAEAINGLTSPEARKLGIARSPKPFCTIVDFVGVGTVHRLVGPLDILGGEEYTPSERALAKKVMDAGTADLYEALEAARARLKAAVSQVKGAEYQAKRSTFDPFSAMGLRPITELPGQFIEPLSSKQRQFLQLKGVPDDILERTSRSQGNQLMRAIIVRDKVGLASVKQLKLLATLGVKEKKVGKGQATWLIDELLKLPPQKRTHDALRLLVQMSKRRVARSAA